MTEKTNIQINKWMPNLAGQITAEDNGATWLVTDLIEKAKDLPILEIPLEHLYIDYNMQCSNIREFVARMKNVMDADLSCPILLDYNGALFDGRHRIAKALFQGEKTIKAKRFTQYISPNYQKDKNNV